MDVTEQPKSRSVQKRSALFVFKILVASWTGFIAAACWRFEAGWVWQLMFITLFLYAVASLVFRWGWLLPCVIAGAICGLGMDNAVKGGSPESRVWETVRSIGFGIGGGFLIGLILDEFDSGDQRTSIADAGDKTFEGTADGDQMGS